MAELVSSVDDWMILGLTATGMDGENSRSIPVDNIRSLLHFATQCIDERLAAYRKGTRYESVRPSDVRVFIWASRGPLRIADLARRLQVSRQAAQVSVQRLQALQIVTLQAVPGNGRDKLVVLTDRGKQALRAGEEQYQRIEAEVAALIGAEGLATLQGLLGRLNAGFGHEEFQRLQDQV